MRFGDTPVSEAEGAILAHSLKLEGHTFKKGRRLSADDLRILAAAGTDSVVAARLDRDDVHEDTAADRLATAVAGPGLSATAAFTGRSNLVATARGLLVLDQVRLERLNLVDEAATLATLAPFALIEPRQMVATIKIIPFAIGKGVLARCLEAAKGATPLLRVAPLQARQVGLVQTTLPGAKPSLLDKTKAAVDARLAALDSPPAKDLRCAHRPDAVAEAIGQLLDQECELLLLSGASAIVDRRDVLPLAIEQAGGAVDHFGMPVDPGNLILLAHLGQVPIIGLPGCARSPKLNGFDWVLQRLLADIPVGREDVMRLGAGGLLKEIGLRPLPRAKAAPEKAPERASAQAPRIPALLLAAGLSRRMGTGNKLLAEIGKVPMVRRVAETLLRSKADGVFAVTGHQAKAVQQQLDDLDITVTHNPDYASGLASSLKRGVATLPDNVDGVLVCLGDMPRVSPKVIDKLIAAFDPLEGRAICVPTWQGKRGNPVLLGRSFFAEIQALEGDTGAKPLLGDHPDAVCEVPVEDDGVLIDADTPDAFERLKIE